MRTHLHAHTLLHSLYANIIFPNCYCPNFFSKPENFWYRRYVVFTYFKKQGRGWKTKRNSVSEFFSVKKRNYNFLECAKMFFKVTDNDAEKVASNFVLSRMSFPSCEKISLSFNFEQKKLWRRMTNCRDSGETDKDKEAKK